MYCTNCGGIVDPSDLENEEDLCKDCMILFNYDDIFDSEVLDFAEIDKIL